MLTDLIDGALQAFQGKGIKRVVLVDNLPGPAILNGKVDDFPAYYPDIASGLGNNVTGAILHSIPKPTDIATS